MNYEHEWSDRSVHLFYTWFKDNINPDPEDRLIQLGDVFDKSANYGKTVELATKLFKRISTKFRKIFVLGGNHDLGFKNNNFQYATEFLSHAFDNIVCLYNETVLEFYDTSVTVLPFKKVEGQLLDKYYSELMNSKLYNSDITCGHVAIKEEGTYFGGIDISKFKNKNFVMGHIHTRNGKYKEYYTGSILPCNITENTSELPRCIKIFDTTTKIFSEIPIPNFVKFDTMDFNSDQGNIAENSSDVVTLYTVKNCNNLQEAKNQYPTKFIYNIEKSIKTNINISVSKDNLLLTPKEAFAMLLKENKTVLKRKTHQLINELLI